MKTKQALSGLLSLLGVAAVLFTGGSTAHAVGAGHCTVVVGNLTYSPALTLVAQPTQMNIESTGGGCLDVSILSDDGQQLLSIGRVEVSGTLTGTASTLFSNYAGTITVTSFLSDGSTRINTMRASCVIGVAGMCPIVGVITDGPDEGSVVEMTPIVVNLNLFGPILRLGFIETAMTFVNPLVF